MGDYNQLLWVRKNNDLVKGPIIELGSKFYTKSTNVDFRSEFAELGFIGTDMEDGPNVDLICDLTSDFSEFPKGIAETKFKTILCCSVMEHVKDIFKASKNVSTLVDKGGILFISVPFIWEVHGYPSDYWRFTPEGLKYLFKDFDFDIHSDRNTISSNTDYDIELIGSDPNRFLFKDYVYHIHSDQKNPIVRKMKRLLSFFVDGKFRNEFILRSVFKRERKFPYTSINMIGIRR